MPERAPQLDEIRRLLGISPARTSMPAVPQQCANAS